MKDYMPVEIYNTKVYVTSDGDVQTWNGKEYVEREWHYNADGYPVVPIIGYKDGKKIYRNIGVHILVALGFVANPLNKPEVNHKDFNRANPKADNLEWVTHKENVAYSRKANRYPSLIGENNPNFGKTTLRKKYADNKKLAKEKQGRPGGRNGKAKKCNLFHKTAGLIGTFDYQRGAVYKLIDYGVVKKGVNLEEIIKKLKTPEGYYGYFLKLI